MENLTPQERLTTQICTIILTITVLEILFLPDNTLKRLLLGGSIIGISLLLIYIFIIHPMDFQSKRYTMDTRSPFSKSETFRPNIVPPSKHVKKTIMRGSCQFCGKTTLMGFTCSYCNEYFCPEHRLPEKHLCFRLEKR